MLSHRGIREEKERRETERMLEDLRRGIAVVEGQNDVKTLAQFSIPAIGLEKFLVEPRTSGIFDGRTIYLVMDLDKGGADKTRRALRKLETLDHPVNYETGLRKKLLALVDKTSVEMTGRRLRAVIDRDGGEKTFIVEIEA